MTETSAFEAFWKSFPRHVGKLAAIKAYARARKLATAEQILAGVERYKQIKPAYADFCHPATWLNQGRWLDEPDTPRTAGKAPVVPSQFAWMDECEEVHGGVCWPNKHIHDARMKGV